MSDDTLDSLAGDDRLVGGEGNDTLIGGDGIDDAHFLGSRADYTIEYNGADDTFVVTDTVGSEGVDILSGIESVSFAGNSEVVDLAVQPSATSSVLQLNEGETVNWHLTVDGGQPDEDDVVDLDYSVEGSGAVLDAADAAGLGFDDTQGDVYATSLGHVQIKSDGTYEYKAGSVKGTDSFDFRVTDSRGLSSVATVSVGVGHGYAYEINHALDLNGIDTYLTTHAGVGW